MNLDLTRKHALVCGASKGIGRATAMELASLGAQVTVMARNVHALEALLAELPGERHHILVADASDIAGLREKVTGHLAANGAAHILVNNSGGPPSGAAAEATSEQFMAAFTQHLLASHTMMQCCLQGMKDAGYGRIVNVISTSVKAPIAGIGVSNTVRAAVANWSKTLAAELAPFGITVNNVLPGATDTDRLAEIFAARAAKQSKPLAEVIAHEKASIPAGRFAQPAELAAAIAFLASPAAAYITGINLPVDGGRLPNL